MRLALFTGVTQHEASWRIAMRPLLNFIKDDSGQDLIEYALLVSFVALISIAALKLLGGKISGFYNTVGNEF
jgi:pilus assembly protein Flp/PilA